MSEFDNPIILASPHEKGPRVRDAQYVLNGHNFFGIDWLKGTVDGEWGLVSGQAANKARWDLGYPERLCDTELFGQTLFDFLRTDGKRTKLPLAYLARRKTRLRTSHSVKAKALAFAATQVGIEEHPAGSNLQPYGSWYGFNGVAWCAIFVTYCNVVGGGDTRVFHQGGRTAYAFWTEDAARAGLYGLRITTDPEPGDVVVYHYHQGHTGIFEKWVNRKVGLFSAIEGNTSASSDDNGGAVRRRERSLSWCPTVFVRLPS